MTKTIIGYTCGVYDMFHIGHLNLLRNARGMCDRLVVGVSTDECAGYKNKTPIIPFEQRIEIVRNVKFVDVAIPQDNLDKLKMWEKLHFDILFVGDDWFGNPKWKQMQDDFERLGVRVVYFPYTKKNSSTLIREILLQKANVKEGKDIAND